MDAPSALDHLIDEAQRRYGNHDRELCADDDLFRTLGIDSMAALDLLSVLEDHFDVEIPDHELRSVRTFRELAMLIERRR